ncbi:integrase arm-type DNA-binding domain-containing protein [Nitrosomonas sp.]|uniref:tyrosine-type recombinase/integrase n=1 Tax=Nitrosomonas sp. TaxID=42353 RepID=UPI002844DD4F|nr:integrase arm-type DNA-binding domain-containing protein [Nitrosomonas sp.]MDR4514905.1 integrase arm-type DNA-binding domain-containing protein [Nitrosomonas sp.]
MPKVIRKLTDLEIRSAKPGETKQDGKGLALVVDVNGNKRWVLRYTRPDGRRNMIGLGSYPEVSATAARIEATEVRTRLRRGIDPVEYRKSEKLEQQTAIRGTFRAIAEEWYSHKAKGWAKETARKAREILDDSLLPKLARKPVADISSADVKPILLEIHERAPMLAVKARQYCCQIISHAIQEGLREDGRELSLKGVLPKYKKSHYAAVTKSGDLPPVIKKIDGITSVHSRVALLVCLYTASRPGVVAGMRWCELNLDTREWHIPASRMKLPFEHITPLPSQLIPILKDLRVLAGESPFVFPGTSDPMNKHIHRDSLSKVLRENGLRGVIVTHGFRATLRTIARERLRIHPDVLEAQLSHAKKGDVQKAYDRTQFLDERHELIQRWADYIDALKNDKTVVQLFKKSV